VAGLESSDHRGGSGGFGADDLRVRHPFGRIGGDSREHSAAADGHDDVVRVGLELCVDLSGHGALTGDRAHIVEGRDQECLIAFGESVRQRGGIIVGGAGDLDRHLLPAEVADAFDLLLRRRLGDEDRALDAQFLAGAGEALRMVARRGAHDSAGAFVGSSWSMKLKAPRIL
jgi:hypothetical protein